MISPFIIQTSEEADSEIEERSELQRALFFCFFALFGEFSIQALIDLSSKFNAMSPSFVRKLSLCICKINVNALKINSSRLSFYGIVIVSFQIDDKDRNSCFFEENFPLADMSRNITFEILLFCFFARFSEFSIQALIDLSSKFNTMLPSFVWKQTLCICKTNVDTLKINSSRLKFYRMVIVSFQVDDKDRNSRFFEEIFLSADMSRNITFEMLLFTLRNIEVYFKNPKLRLRLYTANKVFLTTKQVQLVEKKNGLQQQFLI